MVEFNKNHSDKQDFPIRIDDTSDDSVISESEKRLRDELNRLAIVWEEKEMFAHDTANIQYASGVESCLEDLIDVIKRNAIT